MTQSEITVAAVQSSFSDERGKNVAQMIEQHGVAARIVGGGEVGEFEAAAQPSPLWGGRRAKPGGWGA